MNAQVCQRCGAIVTLVLPSHHLTITCECGQQIGDWQRRAIEAEAEVEKLREAILRVLDDDESQPGGWGPDVTMQAVLREALSEGRKGGGMRYVTGKDNEWIQPVRRGYRVACCDCGLVHVLDFRIAGGRVQYRPTRDNRATGQMRRHRGTVVRKA